MLSHSHNEMETYVSVCQKSLSHCWTFSMDLMSMGFFTITVIRSIISIILILTLDSSSFFLTLRKIPRICWISQFASQWQMTNLIYTTSVTTNNNNFGDTLQVLSHTSWSHALTLVMSVSHLIIWGVTIIMCCNYEPARSHWMIIKSFNLC